MSEADDFLTKTLARQINAETALHDGNPALRLEMWSTRDPVTLCKSGSDEVTRISRWARCGSPTVYSFELIASGVSEDLAYTVGYEHSLRSVGGGPVEPSTLRVTHVYRREYCE